MVTQQSDLWQGGWSRGRALGGEPGRLALEGPVTSWLMWETDSTLAPSCPGKCRHKPTPPCLSNLFLWKRNWSTRGTFLGNVTVHFENGSASQEIKNTNPKWTPCTANSITLPVLKAFLPLELRMDGSHGLVHLSSTFEKTCNNDPPPNPLQGLF